MHRDFSVFLRASKRTLIALGILILHKNVSNFNSSAKKVEEVKRREHKSPEDDQGCISNEG